MDTAQDLKQLSELGFSEKEGYVYLSLLKLGEVGASKIVKDTGLHGQFVYTALNTLEKKGLVKHVIVKSRKKFSAQPPRTIEAYIESKKKSAIELVERLQKEVIAPDEQSFEIYQGTEAYAASELVNIQNARPGSEILVLAGRGDQYPEALGGSFMEYEKIRQEKDCVVKYIGDESQATDLVKYESTRYKFIFRKLPEVFSSELNISVYEDRLVFVLFGTPVVAFTFINKKVTGSFRSFFDVLWKLAR